VTADEAHHVVVSISSARATGRESFAHEALVEAYDAADAATQRRILDACEVLVLDGSEHDRVVAAGLLATVQISPDLLQRLVDEYRARGLDDSAPLAEVVGRNWPILDAGDLKKIEQVFLAAPEHQLIVGRALLYHEADGAPWQTLMELVARSNDPDTLGKAAKAASAAEKLPKFYAAMKSKPVEVRQATAERITSANYDDYMRAVGLLAN
jgi:hypothetical protein